MIYAIVLATLGALVALRSAARNAITICVVQVQNGELAVVRGAIAPRVLSDLGDVVRRRDGKGRVRFAMLRIVRDRGRALLHADGDLSDAQLQQLRNVVGSVPLAKLTNARRR